MLAINDLSKQLNGVAYDKETGKIFSRFDSDLVVVGIINASYIDSAYVRNGVLDFSFDSTYDLVADAVSPIVSLTTLDDSANPINWTAVQQTFVRNSPLKIVSGTGGAPPYSVVLSRDFQNDEMELGLVSFRGVSQTNSIPNIGIYDSDIYDDFLKIDMIFSHDGAFVSDFNYPEALKLLNVGVPLINLKGSFSNQLSNATGLDLSSDGKILVMTDDTTNSLHEYEFETPNDISSLQKTGKSFNIYKYQGTNPTDVVFNSTGSKMYVSDENDRKIYQYNLSTPYDISTARFDVSYYEEDDISRSGFLAKNGTKYYTVNASGTQIIQYDLTEPYSIASASNKVIRSIGTYQQIYVFNFYNFYPPGKPTFVSRPFRRLWIGTYVHTSYIQDVCFSNDGRYLYVWYGIAQFRGQLRRYTLSTPWDISTMSNAYDSIFHEIGVGVDQYYPNNAKDNGAWGIRISDDGSKLYVLDKTNMAVYQYNFSTNYDIDSIASTLVFSNADRLHYLNEIPQSVYVTGLEFKDDGTAFYVSDNSKIYEYSLPVARELNSVSYVGSYAINTIDNTTRSIDLKSDGTKLYIQGFRKITEHDLNPAYDISSQVLSKIDKVLALPSGADPNGLYMNDSDNSIYITSNQTNEVYQYDLSIPEEISTGTLTATFTPPGTVTDVQGIDFSDDETRFVLISGNSMFEFDVGPTFDASTFNGNLYNSTGQVNTLKGFRYTSDGGFFFTTGTSASSIDLYSIDTPFSIKPI